MIAIFFFAWLIPVGLASENGEEKTLIFLTNWGYIVWVANLLWSAFSCTLVFVYYFFLRRKQFADKFRETESRVGRYCSSLVLDEKPNGCCGSKNDQTFWHQKIQWVLYNMATVLAIGISVLFWSLLYDPDTVDELDYEVDGGVNLNTHAINGLVALIDIFVTGIPIRLLHIVYPVAFTSTYVVFTGIYHAFNGTDVNDDPYIYPVINYGDYPGTATGVVFAVTFVFIPLLYLFIFSMYLTREGIVYLTRSYCCGKCFEEPIEKRELETSLKPLTSSN